MGTNSFVRGAALAMLAAAAAPAFAQDIHIGCAISRTGSFAIGKTASSR